MRIFLLNDTTSGHAGMRAVMASLHHRLVRHDIIGRHRVGELAATIPDDVDAVVCNGEGTIHHDSLCGQVLLGTLRCAQERGLETHLVNAVFQQKTPYYADVLSKLSTFTVREPWSQRCAEASGGHPVLARDLSADPELLPLDMIQRHRTDIRVGEWPFAPWIQAEHPDWRPLNLYAGPFYQIINTLRRATVYITGQHHGVYAAALAEAPFVPIPSNSWKIEGLLDWFHTDTGESIPIARTPAQIHEGIHFAYRNPAVFAQFSRWLHTTPVWAGLTQGVTI